MRAGMWAGRAIAATWCAGTLGFAGWVLSSWWSFLSDDTRRVLIGLPLMILTLALVAALSSWAWQTVIRWIAPGALASPRYHPTFIVEKVGPDEFAVKREDGRDTGARCSTQRSALTAALAVARPLRGRVIWQSEKDRSYREVDYGR
jgi:hypothetical protein